MPNTEPFIGEVALFANNFAPRGWMPCSGQLLAISTNQALFSILGTTYGGNGVTNFALPNLNGRAAVGAGWGPGLSYYGPGQQGGEQSVTLNSQQIPTHVHQTRGSSANATTGTPVGTLPAAGNVALYTSQATDNVTTPHAGGSQPHDNTQPSLGLLYCIATVGIFPSRN